MAPSGYKSMMTVVDLATILREIHFHGWSFKFGVMGEGMYMQVQFLAPDNDTKELHQVQSGRKWYISHFSTKEEVVQTCLKAVLTAVEHEAREHFTYKGVALFQPHMPLETLMEHAQEKIKRTEMVSAEN